MLPSEVITSLAGPRGCSRIELVPGSLDRRRDRSVPSIRGENDTGVRDHPAPRGKRRARPRHVCLTDVDIESGFESGVSRIDVRKREAD